MVRFYLKTIAILLLAVLSGCSSLKVSSRIDTSITEQGTRKVLYVHKTYSERVTDVGSDLVITMEYPLEFEADLELSNIRVTSTLAENMGYKTSSPEVTFSEIVLRDSTYSTRYVCAECPFKLRMGIIEWKPSH